MSKIAVNLSDVCTLKTGKLNSNAAVENGIFPFFTCSKETFRINKYAFDTEAVLLAGNNANGIFPLKHYSGKFNAYQRTYVIETKDKNKLSTRYLYYALHPALKHFESASIGAATQYLTKGILDKFELQLPEIITQNRIASVLSAYDDLIENNRRRIALLEEAGRLLYREWFVYFRFPGHEHVRILDGVPEGWELKDLGNVAENLDRQRVPLSVMEREKRQGTFPYHGAAGILDYVDDFLFDGRYLLMGEDGTVTTKDGKPMLQLVQGKFWVSNHAHVLHGIEVSTEFLFCVLSNYQISGHVTGVAQPKVTQKNMNRIPVLVPEQSILDDFQEVVSIILDQRFVLADQIEAFTKARDLLLPRLMDGRLEI